MPHASQPTAQQQLTGYQRLPLLVFKRRDGSSYELQGQHSSMGQHRVAALHSVAAQQEPVTTGAALPPARHAQQPWASQQQQQPAPQQAFAWSTPPAHHALPAAWPAGFGGPFSQAMPHPSWSVASASAAAAAEPAASAALQWGPVPCSPLCAAPLDSSAADALTTTSPFAAVAAVPLPPAEQPLPLPSLLPAGSLSQLLAELQDEDWEDDLLSPFCGSSTVGGTPREDARRPFAGWHEGAAALTPFD